MHSMRRKDRQLEANEIKDILQKINMECYQPLVKMVIPMVCH